MVGNSLVKTIPLHNQEGLAIGTAPLPEALVAPVNKAVLWQAVRMYLANQRQGMADTRTRGEVRGGGRKPWRQKHTGRARHGSIRSPIWRKGGIVFGPHPREYRYALPEKIRRAALVNSLRAKAASDSFLAVKGIEGLSPKTKVLSEMLKRMKLSEGALLVVDRPLPLLRRISRNLPHVVVKPASDLTCYDVLRFPKLVLTPEALKKLETILS